MNYIQLECMLLLNNLDIMKTYKYLIDKCGFIINTNYLI